jgi:hypothetical protein
LHIAKSAVIRTTIADERRAFVKSHLEKNTNNIKEAIAHHTINCFSIDKLFTTPHICFIVSQAISTNFSAVDCSI